MIRSTATTLGSLELPGETGTQLLPAGDQLVGKSRAPRGNGNSTYEVGDVVTYEV